MKYFKWYEGDRIYFSPINPDDYEIYTKWVNDPAVTEGVGMRNKVFSLQNERKALEKMSESSDNFAIILKGDNPEGDRLIGNCSFNDPSPARRISDIGLFIGEESDRNKGYGSEAINLLLDIGFMLRNYQNIMLKVFSFNKGAIRCYEKCGFKLIGARRQAYYLNGEYYDDIFMDITMEDYRRIRDL